jgi:Protein of unknown function (DUF2721)
MPQAIDTVAAMIAPALFLTATGSLLISTSTRIGRIVDRIRVIVTLCEGGQLEQLDFPDLRRKHAVDELNHLQSRSNRVSAAVTMLYLAFSAFAATSMLIAINAVTGNHIEGLPVVCAVAGVGLLLVACINLVLEARSSLQGNGREVAFFHELEGLRVKVRADTRPRAATTERAGQPVDVIPDHRIAPPTQGDSR